MSRNRASNIGVPGIPELVSAIIPTFNRAHCIVGAIGSVLRQTHRELEVVVVDDGSDDDTESTIRRNFGADSRIQYVRQANAGVAAARNRALTIARGDYVAFLDSDDTWFPWKTEAQLFALRLAPGAEMIWSDMRAVDPGGAVLHERYLRKLYSAYQARAAEAIFPHSSAIDARHFRSAGADPIGLYWGDIFAEMIFGNLVHTSTVLLTRRRLTTVGSFDEALRPSGEDYHFHLRTCAAGPVAFLDAPTINYRVGAADQLTHPQYRVAILRNSLRAIESVLATDGARITTPPAELGRYLADRNLKIALELIRSGEAREARKYLRRSRALQGPSRRGAALLAASWLPHGPLDSLIRLRRAFRALLRSGDT